MKNGDFTTKNATFSRKNGDFTQEKLYLVGKRLVSLAKSGI